MAITEVAYCTREAMQRSLNLADNPRLNARVDSAIMAGARQVEGLLHRRFYPETKTVAFDQPTGSDLWLYELEMSSLPTQILSGTQAMTLGTDVFARPKSGPPYRWLEASYGGSVYWQSTATPQGAISITGDFGYPVTPVGATTLGLTVGAGVSMILLNDSSAIGVGSLILIDGERMIVSEKAMSTTGVTLAADLTSAKSATQVTVSSGALINPGEMLMLDGERMYVEYVTGNVLTVDRAVNAAALSAHTAGAMFYAARQATVLRGRLGTAVASHSSGAIVTRLDPPGLITELNLAYAINNQQGANSAYARSLEQDLTGLTKDRGRGVIDIENDAYQAYGRKVRGRAIGA